MEETSVQEPVASLQAHQTRLKEINDFAERNHTTHPEECVALMEEAIALYSEMGNIPLVVRTLHRKAFSLRTLIQFDETIDAFATALDICHDNNLKDEQATLYKQLSDIYCQQGNFEKAREYIVQAIRLYGELGKYTEQVGVLSDLANTAFSEGK